MNLNLKRWIVGLQIGWIALAGCHPTQPFFIRERGDLAQYLNQAQKIEYPDLNFQPIPEVTQSFEPLSLDNQKFEFLDLSLEECVAYALANTHIVRAIPGTQRQNVDITASILTTPSQQLNTISDAAIVATTTNSQPLSVDQNGNRILPRGPARANQVGGVEDALSEFDAQFSSFFSYNTTDRARNVGAGNVFNPQLFQGRDSTGQMAISKRTATGGVVTFRSQSIYSFNNIPTQTLGNPNNFGRAVPADYTQVIEAQVQHPLLRNRGTLVNRIPVVLARINEEQAIQTFEERVRNVVRDVEYAYWDLYLAYWNVENARIARDSAAQAYHIAFEKLKMNASATTAAQAKLTYHDFQSQLYAALAGGNVQGGDPGLFGREQYLRFLMGWSATDGRLVRPSDKPTFGWAQFQWYDSLDETLNRNIDLRQQQWAIKRAELELMSAKNQILPDLNVSLLYRWLGVGGSLLDSKGGNGPFPPNPGQSPPSAWEELLTGTFQEGAVRLEFTPNPLGSRRTLADVRNKQLALANEHKKLETKQEAATFVLSKSLRDLNSNYAQMNEQLSALNAANQSVRLYTERFEAGEFNDQTVDLLLRAQQSRANAGRNYTRALTEYNKSITDVHLVKGSLLEYNNIALEEGLWPQKAYWDAHERARERDAAQQLDYGASRPKVISRGEYQQFRGTANDQVTQPKTQIKNKEVEPLKKETVPAVPEKSDELPLKKASSNEAPKFSWGT